MKKPTMGYLPKIKGIFLIIIFLVLPLFAKTQYVDTPFTYTAIHNDPDTLDGNFYVNIKALNFYAMSQNTALFPGVQVIYTQQRKKYGFELNVDQALFSENGFLPNVGMTSIGGFYNFSKKYKIKNKKAYVTHFYTIENGMSTTVTVSAKLPTVFKKMYGIRGGLMHERLYFNEPYRTTGAYVGLSKMVQTNLLYTGRSSRGTPYPVDTKFLRTLYLDLLYVPITNKLNVLEQSSEYKPDLGFRLGYQWMNPLNKATDNKTTYNSYINMEIGARRFVGAYFTTTIGWQLIRKSTTELNATNNAPFMTYERDTVFSGIIRNDPDTGAANLYVNLYFPFAYYNFSAENTGLYTGLNIIYTTRHKKTGIEFNYLNSITVEGNGVTGKNQYYSVGGFYNFKSKISNDAIRVGLSSTTYGQTTINTITVVPLKIRKNKGVRFGLTADRIGWFNHGPDTYLTTGGMYVGYNFMKMYDLYFSSGFGLKHKREWRNYYIDVLYTPIAVADIKERFKPKQDNGDIGFRLGFTQMNNLARNLKLSQEKGSAVLKLELGYKRIDGFFGAFSIALQLVRRRI